MKDSRHPFEVFILIMCVVTGIPLLFGSASPGSIDASLSPLARLAWAGLLSIGAIIALAGVALRKTNGLLIEQVGLCAVGGATIVYAAAVFAYFGTGGSIAAGITLGFGVACFTRVVQIQRAVQKAVKR